MVFWILSLDVIYERFKNVCSQCNTEVHAMECNRSMHLRKVCPQCNTVVHLKRAVFDCGHAFSLKKRKIRCTAVGKPENTMKLRKALLPEEVLVRKESKRASETHEQILHRQEQNRITHKANKMASETSEQTWHRQQQFGVHKASISATETPSESSIT